MVLEDIIIFLNAMYWTPCLVVLAIIGFFLITGWGQKRASVGRETATETKKDK